MLQSLSERAKTAKDGIKESLTGERAQGLHAAARDKVQAGTEAARGAFRGASDKASEATTAARDKVQVGADVARGAAYTGLETAKGAAGSTLAKAREAYSSTHALGESLGGMIQERVDVRGLRDAGYGMVGDQLKQSKIAAKVALLNLSRPVRQRVLFGLREVIKTNIVADPDMWNCCSRRIQDGIDVFWDDLTVYIETIESDTKDSIREKTIADIQELGDLGDKPRCLSPWWFRAQILYHYLPFDLSIFAQVKDFWFWVLTAFSVCTLYGVRVVFFLLLLVMILLPNWPGDEYQMVQFIIAFKGTQFLSSGVVMSIMAAVQYYLCVHPGGTHTCDTQGPGVKVDVISSAIDFFGCCILVWLAYLLLPTCQRSAGTRDLGKDPKEGTVKRILCCNCDTEKGGRLTGLLGYDFVCFLASCGLLCGLAYYGSHQTGLSWKEELNTWEFKSAIFWARIFYSLLAFPFTIYIIPGLNSILTHTSPTGYNRQGLCVPYMLHPMPEAAE